jgi:hypothetical protein
LALGLLEKRLLRPIDVASSGVGSAGSLSLVAGTPGLPLAVWSRLLPSFTVMLVSIGARMMLAPGLLLSGGVTMRGEVATGCPAPPLSVASVLDVSAGVSGGEAAGSPA